MSGLTACLTSSQPRSSPLVSLLWKKSLNSALLAARSLSIPAASSESAGAPEHEIQITSEMIDVMLNVIANEGDEILMGTRREKADLLRAALQAALDTRPKSRP